MKRYIEIIYDNCNNMVSGFLSYCRSHDCIYWDFSDARWKYFKQQNLVKQVNNPDAQYEDGLSDFNKKNIEQKEYFTDREIYTVDHAPLKNKSYQLLPLNHLGNINKPINLKPGDIVKFEG